MKTPEEIKTDLVAWGTGVRIDIGCGEFVPPTPKYMLNGVRSSDVCRDALSYIKQLEAQVPQWISVEDRLPEEHRYVLVHLRWGAIATGVHNGRNWWDELTLVNNDNVTHWMPPPEPPKEG